MNIETLEGSLLACNTYIVGTDSEVYIIDPAASLLEIQNTVKNRKVLAVLLTHGHFDHFLSLDDCVNKYEVKCYLHKNALLKIRERQLNCSIDVGDPIESSLRDECFEFVSEGSRIQLSSDLLVKALYTPGHSNCGITFDINTVLFTGDTLFRNGVGRTDLPTGNTSHLINSIRRLIETRFDQQIYAGHYKPTSTHTEKRINGFYLKTSGNRR
jgi:hydroxyacylglutathione hydrolase